jgi:hypothetical protein
VTVHAMLPSLSVLAACGALTAFAVSRAAAHSARRWLVWASVALVVVAGAALAWWRLVP